MSVHDSVMRSQSALVSAIYGFSGEHEFDLNGLTVYQRSLAANAERALAISFPTIQQLIGEQVFSRLSHDFLHDYPLVHGDWGEWGQAFPGWLSGHEELQDYPYFGDCAQLDWCCHICERVQDASVDIESLSLLAGGDPYKLKLSYNSSAMLVLSEHPVVDIWNAHNLNSEHGLATAVQGIAQQIAQNALVWRPQWKAHVRHVCDEETLWLQLTQQGESIGAALDQLEDSHFSFETWLPDALNQHIICGIDHITNSTL